MARNRRTQRYVELVLPRLTDDLLEPLTITRVLHGAGTPVREGESVVELIHREGMFVVPAPATGLITEVLIAPGQQVFAGARLLIVQTHAGRASTIG